MLKKIAAGVVTLFIVIIALGFILPDQVHVQREAIIDAPRDDVFAKVSDFHQWHEWSPWFEQDPNMQQTITGSGLGHHMSWVSEDPYVGSGSMTIVTIDKPGFIEHRMDFGDQGGGIATMVLTDTDDGKTKLVWMLDTNMRDGVPLYMKPISTYMGFFMDGMLGPYYERGLENLNEVI